MQPSSGPVPFGPYVLLRRLGAGGMAEVYLAVARGTGGFEKLLCIKRVRPERARDAAFITALVEEAKIVAGIVHPNVAQVFDLGCIDGEYYVAMELVDGVDVFRMLHEAEQRKVHLPIPAAALVVQKVCLGLHAAHTLCGPDGRPYGIVHRDVSPHNVLVSREGEVKLIDFGVAKASLRAQQTEAGLVKGKYNYLAPEQARGDPVDARTDVFAAGILLFEMLAGEPLYRGDRIADLLDQTRRARIPNIRRLRPDVPRPLAVIVRTALRRDPEDRYPTAAAFASALGEYLSTHEPAYGAHDLASLVEWLFPSATDLPAESSRVHLMRLDDYVSAPGVSLVSAPGVARAERVERPNASDELEAVATRIAAPRPAAAPTSLRTGPEAVRDVPSGLVPTSTTMAIRARARRRRLAAVGAATISLGVAATAAVLWLASGSPRSTLVVESTPPGARLSIGGRDTGARTPTRQDLKVAPGRSVLVRLDADGHEPWEREVYLVEGETRVEAVLAEARGTLTIHTVPPDAEVRVDGVPRGHAPVVLEGLPLDRDVTVSVSRPGYIPEVRLHRWMQGQRTAVLEIPLIPEGEPTSSQPSGGP
ncbi:MAG: protein kinase [Myxococcota bacterium]|nr:protein kinase [Myxococcota bacterium]